MSAGSTMPPPLARARDQGRASPRLQLSEPLQKTQQAAWLRDSLLG